MYEWRDQSELEDGIVVDAERIREELSEQVLMPGAFCQDYEVFKNIFRFVERRLRRTHISSYIILLTLTNGEGRFPESAQREAQMTELKDIIQTSLRSGDVFTQYSSCQFLIMVCDVSEADIGRIANRIVETFQKNSTIMQNRLLLHQCYPMQAARSGEKLLKADKE